MSTLYADDPTGGPESPNIINVMVRLINYLAIKGHRGHGGSFWLVALNNPA
jgi:hypothetical protein